jgi:hypothetical protein
VGARLGVFLAFLAVLAALLAPVSLLVQEVRTGKLGGICSAGLASTGKLDASSGEALPAASHCDWCTSVALVLPPPVSSIPCFPGFQVVIVDFPADLAASIIGLPFSRGPPRFERT